MTIRFLILSLAGSAWSAATAAPPPDRTLSIEAKWADDVTTPAICVEKSSWFASIVPESVPLDELKAPTLSLGENEVAGKVLFVDSVQRLCLIESEILFEGATPVSLAASGKTKAGASLHCRSGGGRCRTTVAGKDRNYFGELLPAPLLRVRIEGDERFCHPGTPLFNETGELEGLLTERRLATPVEAHAIPASRLTKLILEFERFEHSGAIWLGLLFHDKTSTPEVLETRPDSPATKGGLKSGDVILSVNDLEVKNLNELSDLCSELVAGKKAKFTVLRGHEKQSLSVVPEFERSEQ